MLILSQLRPLSPQFEQNKDKILTDAFLVAKTTNISQWITKYVYLSVWPCFFNSVSKCCRIWKYTASQLDKLLEK